MTLVALLSAGLILGLAFNVYGLLGLSLLIVPVYFVGSLHLGLPQAFASTFQAITIFELAFFCGIMTQNLWLRRFVPDLQIGLEAEARLHEYESRGLPGGRAAVRPSAGDFKPALEISLASIRSTSARTRARRIAGALFAASPKATSNRTAAARPSALSAVNRRQSEAARRRSSPSASDRASTTNC